LTATFAGCNVVNDGGGGGGGGDDDDDIVTDLIKTLPGIGLVNTF
jgi:hypothetical protein